MTICTRDRACLFGTIVGSGMELNEAGRIARSSWEELPTRFSNITTDLFVVMPNHIHGIILVGAQFIAPARIAQDISGGMQQGAINRAPTLGEIIRTYKAVSTRVIRKTAYTAFAWQRNYYEHVIRDDDSLNRIRQYIFDNPARWASDRENPAATMQEAEEPWDADRIRH